MTQIPQTPAFAPDLSRPLRAGEHRGTLPEVIPSKTGAGMLTATPRRQGDNRPARPGERRAEAHQPSENKDGEAMLTAKPSAESAMNHEIRLALLAYKTESGLSNKALAKALGFGSGTIVSAYLNNNPRGEWMKLQANAADFLANEKRRRVEGRLTLRETPTTRQFTFVVDLIRSTNDFALITGNAGAGKTCAVALYCQRNPNTVPICVAEWKKDVSGLVNALMEAVGWQAWDGKTPRGIWLEDRFKGSNRLIIVDNAQRLTAPALAWLFDFHDATGCPVCLVGNPDVLVKIRANDQFFSRVGIREEVGPKTIAEAEEFAHAMLGDLAPELIGEIGAEASVRLHGQGHGRALAKQVRLTTELLKTPHFRGRPQDAFAAARQKLVTADDAKLAGKGGK